MKSVATFITGLAVLLPMSGAWAEAHPHGIDFVHKAVEGDISETRLGTLAARKGQSAGIRAFGRMLAMDHSRGRIEAAAVARQVHTFAPKSMTAEAIVEQQKLDKLSGRDFDREFASYMVQDHKEDIADFESEASTPDKPVIVALAKKTLPVLQKHLATAQKLAAQ